MKLKNMTVLCAVALAALSCNKTEEFKRAEKGPDMTVASYTESTYMGAVITVNVNITDKDFALSTVKASLLYGETEVANTTVRTKTEGEYAVKIQAPLLKDVPNGTASLVLKAQNVGLGITEKTLDVALKRPNFETLTLKAESGATYTLKKTEEYVYEVEGDFPAYLNANIVTPEFNGGEVITLGWDGSGLSDSKSDLIPFGASIAGKYKITANLLSLEVSPTGSASVVSVAEYKQGQQMDFGNIVSVDNWTLDPDFFDVDKETKIVTFRAVDGLYKMDYDTKNMFIRVEPMKDASTPLSLSSDGTGAVWVIGSGFGKPVIGPSWNTDEGAYPMACVSPKVYEFTLAVPAQLGQSNGEIKLFHQKGWGEAGCEFVKSDFSEISLSPAFTISDSGNIKAEDLKSGKGYKFTLDLTGGLKAAKISYEEVEVETGGLDIEINGEKALKLSSTVYKVTAVEVQQNSIITYKGIDNPLEWTFDRDHFELTDSGLKFKAITGYYSFELDIENKYVIVRHVKSDGKAATYANEGAITFMGWGVGYPAMAQQLGFDSGLLVTLAQIEKGVYQFTGVACEDKDETVVGNCWRYNDISFKFFGQAGWGVEWNKVTLTDEAKKYLAQDGNVELIVESQDGDEKVFKPLELGATYRMTVTDCTSVVDSKFDVTIDFKKL